MNLSMWICIHQITWSTFSVCVTIHILYIYVWWHVTTHVLLWRRVTSVTWFVTLSVTWCDTFVTMCCDMSPFQYVFVTSALWHLLTCYETLWRLLWPLVTSFCDIYNLLWHLSVTYITGCDIFLWLVVTGVWPVLAAAPPRSPAMT
jgi:hypothetical protein